MKENLNIFGFCIVSQTKQTVRVCHLVQFIQVTDKINTFNQQHKTIISSWSSIKIFFFLNLQEAAKIVCGGGKTICFSFEIVITFGSI